MARNVIEVANRIIRLARTDVGDLISNLKVQKILYYVQGFHLAMYGKPIFNEDIYAWQHGPVVKEAYHHFKEFGAGHIELSNEDVEKHYVEFSDAENQLMFDVWDAYGQYSAYRLMTFTHEEPPWRSTPINRIISHQKLKDYFATQIHEIAE